MSNPWELNWNGPGDQVIAPPDPYKQSSEQRADRSIELQEERLRYEMQRDQREDAQKAEEERAKAMQAKEAQNDAVASLARTIEKIDTIKADVTDSWTGVGGLGETGMSGYMQSGIPGSAAYSLRKDIKTIDATQVLQAMTRLKELSPTGSTGFGALSAPELELLRSSVANLDPDMDQETFMANLDAARQVYADMLARIQSGGQQGADLITQALREGRSRQEILDIAAQNNLQVDEAALDENLRSRDQGGPVNRAVPPDIEAIMQKYGV